MDERDQDVQRTPLWPPDPEPGSEAPRPLTSDPSPERVADWAADWAPDAPATPPDTASPHQAYQSDQAYQAYQSDHGDQGDQLAADAPSAPVTEQPQPWTSAGVPWAEPQPEAAPSLSDAPTAHISAAPAPTPAMTDAPAQQPVAPPPAITEAPTQQYAAMPPAPPTEAPTHQYVAPPPAPPAKPTTPAPMPAITEAPTQQYVAAPAAPATPAAPARKRSGPLWRLGVTLLISVLLLVGALSIYSHAAALAAEPQQLMTRYCAALTHDDYRTAYSLLAASAQAQQPEEQYLADAAARDAIEGRITACSAKPTQTLSALSFLRSPRSLIFNAQVTRKQAASGQIALTRDAQGWHVAALSSPLQGIDLGPLATQQALCKALNTRAYSQAYALLSTPYQQEQGSAVTFARSFGDTLTVTACAANLKTYSVNSADQQATFDVTLTLSFVGATSGSPPTAFTLPTKFTFVREATGWRVDDIKPLLAQ